MEEAKKTDKTKKLGWYSKLSLQKRTGLWGLIFLSPWLIGFLVFFIKPLIEVVFYSFNDVSINNEGNLQFKFVGLDNYIRALTVDPEFNQKLVTTVVQSIPSVVLIIIFSLFSAILINGKFKGRMLARGIFFIPIIMAASAGKVQIGGAAAQAAFEVAEETSLLGVGTLANLLVSSGLDKGLVDGLLKSVSSIFYTITLSGVQILIFLAGLQSISSSLYEVAKIEGATTYETFWKVTFPMVSPMILTCSIYSLADGFMRSEMTDRAYEVAFQQSKFGLSASMSFIFLIVCLVIMGVVAFLISRKVFYYD